LLRRAQQRVVAVLEYRDRAGDRRWAHDDRRDVAARILVVVEAVFAEQIRRDRRGLALVPGDEERGSTALVGVAREDLRDLDREPVVAVDDRCGISAVVTVVDRVG